MPKIVVHTDNEVIELQVPSGSNLRDQLLLHGLSPYGTFSKALNCGGRGLCATCGVYILDGTADDVHWHDQLAKRFRYPRLTCQITVMSDLTIQLVAGKKMWGNRHPKNP